MYSHASAYLSNTTYPTQIFRCLEVDHNFFIFYKSNIRYYYLYCHSINNDRRNE